LAGNNANKRTGIITDADGLDQQYEINDQDQQIIDNCNVVSGTGALPLNMPTATAM